MKKGIKNNMRSGTNVHVTHWLVWGHATMVHVIMVVVHTGGWSISSSCLKADVQRVLDCFS